MTQIPHLRAQPHCSPHTAGTRRKGLLSRRRPPPPRKRAQLSLKAALLCIQKVRRERGPSGPPRRLNRPRAGGHLSETQDLRDVRHPRDAPRRRRLALHRRLSRWHDRVTTSRAPARAMRARPSTRRPRADRETLRPSVVWSEKTESRRTCPRGAAPPSLRGRRRGGTCADGSPPKSWSTRPFELRTRRGAAAVARARTGCRRGRVRVASASAAPPR